VVVGEAVRGDFAGVFAFNNAQENEGFLQGESNPEFVLEENGKMTFRVLHHNNCFDGACSAAVFTKFHRECVGGAESYEYHGLAHQPGGAMSQDIFGPEENAIVDFKYSPSPRLTWWFDHHESAFPTPEMRAEFELGQLGEKGRRQFFNPDYISCTGLIADIGREKFNWDTSGLEDLLKWADIIDGARFANPEAAVEMREPAMKVALAIENAQDPGFIPRIIPLLTSMPFAQILEQAWVEERLAPLWEQHQATKELIRQRTILKDGVNYLEILDRDTDALNKFIPYYFHPEATYTIAVTKSKARTKVSVGTSPWTTVPVGQLVNLSEVCGRYGGGGHARVGAISYGPGDEELARQVATEIVGELREVERQR
jgi:hypothetical protein